MNSRLLMATLLTITLLFSIAPAYALPDNTAFDVQSDFWNWVNSGKEWMWNTFVKPILDTLTTMIKNGINMISSTLWKGLSDAFSTLFDMLTAPFKQVATAWGNLYTDTIKVLPSWATPFAPLLITGIAAGGIIVIVYIVKWIVPGI